jgi:hypothetical protein
MVDSSTKEPAVLLVAETPDASSTLAAAVRERVQARRSWFMLLVPAVVHGLRRVVDPEDHCCDEAERTVSSLRPAIEAAAGEPITASIGSHEPLAAIEDALGLREFDEIVLATRSSRLARLLHLDLASKVKELGVPVTVVGLVSKSKTARHPATSSEVDMPAASASASPWPHSREEAEVEEIVKALRGYRVLTSRRLAEECGAAHWSDSGFRRALAQAISTGRVRRLSDDLYEISESSFR